MQKYMLLLAYLTLVYIHTSSASEKDVRTDQKKNNTTDLEKRLREAYRKNIAQSKSIKNLESENNHLKKNIVQLNRTIDTLEDTCNTHLVSDQQRNLWLQLGSIKQHTLTKYIDDLKLYLIDLNEKNNTLIQEKKQLEAINKRLNIENDRYKSYKVCPLPCQIL